MVEAERGLSDSQGPLQLGASTSQIPKTLQHASQVVPAGGNPRMIRARGGLSDGQGPLQLGASASQIPEILQHASHVAADGGDVGVIRAIGGLSDGQGPLQLDASASQIPERPEHNVLRSFVVCAMCGRRMCGRASRGQHTYYGCELAQAHGPLAAIRWPDHPKSIYVREDALLDGILDFFATRILGPDRYELLAADLAATDHDAIRAWEQRRTALQRTIDDDTTRRARLLGNLEQLIDPDPDPELLADIQHRAEELNRHRKARQAELDAMAAAPPSGTTQAPELLHQIPAHPAALEHAPAPILRELFEAFRLEVTYDRATNHATCRVTLSDDTLHRSHAALHNAIGNATGDRAPAPVGTSNPPTRTHAYPVPGATGRGNKAPQNDLRRLVLQCPFFTTKIRHESSPEPTTLHARAKARTQTRCPTPRCVRTPDGGYILSRLHRNSAADGPPRRRLHEL
jgi:Recombinase zinc beta ribbon domain